MNNPLLTPIQFIKGVGPSYAKHLTKLNIHTVHDFLYNFPRAYEDRRNLPKIGQLKIGDTCSVVGLITATTEETTRQKWNLVKCVLSDQQAKITVVWFNQPYLKKVIKVGKLLLVKGKVELSKYTHELQMLATDFELIDKPQNLYQVIGRVMPSYPLAKMITQAKLRSIAQEIIVNYLPNLYDPLPSYIKKYGNFIDLNVALGNIHFPSSGQKYLAARHRLVFDEFFYFQLTLMQKRYFNLENTKGLRLIPDGPFTRGYLEALPYQLTKAQVRVIQEIAADVTGLYAMNRLLQGDVGAGKTDVAAMALLFAVQSGHKGAVMAPTEILATQHYYKFKKHLSQLDVPVILLKGQIKGKQRAKILEELTSSKPLIIIGTHALLEDDVIIAQLAMVIIDEQHRFGVGQRTAFQQKGINPHCLYLTATPIPRSLMLTVYGDLFKSILDELPPGRQPPKTAKVSEHNLVKVFEFCRQELLKGLQIYVVYPLIEESEKLDLKSAIEGAEYLQKEIFKEFKVGLLHGKMKPKEKEAIMDSFKSNEIKVLVATTVIEVGVDVPNANVMLIWHAERFGLAQLHQLRGRIGRGATQSFCFLISNPKSEEGKKRIAAMLETTDGFKLAEYDLGIRGPGDLLGIRQSGLPDFNLADLIRDEKILVLSQRLAQKIIQDDPHLAKAENRPLLEILKHKPNAIFSERLH